MAEMGIKIVLQGGVTGTAKNLDSQLKDVKLTPLSIKVNIDNSSIEKVIKSNNNLSNSTKQITNSTNQQISSIDKLIGRYKAGLITYQEFDKYGSKIAQSDNFRSKSLEQQSKLINALSTAEKQRTKILSEDQAIRDKQSSQEQTNHSKRLKSLQQEIQLQQQIKAKQISQYSPIGGDKSINLASMERFNKYIADQNNAYKAGRISQEQYVQSVDRIIAQTQKWALADDSLRAKILSNRNQINKANNQSSGGGGVTKLLDVDKAKNDLIRLEQSMSKIMGSPTWKSSTKAQREEFDKLSGSIRSASLNLGNMSRSDFANFLRNTKTSINGLNGEIQNADRNSLKLGDSLKQAFLKFPIWMGATTIFMQFFHTIRDGIVYIKEFDDALVELQKVTEFTSGTYRDMQMSAISLGKELGKSSVDIMKSYAEFGRVTKIKEEIESLASSAAIASNVTSMSAETAAKAINTTMIAFKINAKDSIQIIDVWNELQNSYKVSAEDMSEAIGKVGAAAYQTGMSFSKLNAITATLTGATGLSGSEIGTMEKTMLSRIFRLGEEGADDAGKTEEALNKIGIAVRKSAIEFRNSEDIIDDLAKKWETLNSTERMGIAQQVGGTWHYQKVVALMSNYNTVIAANVKALNSQGSAYRENEKRMDSITGRLGILKATMEGKFNSFLSSDMFKSVITSISTLIERLGNLKTISIDFIAVMALWKGAALLSFFTALPSKLAASAANMLITRGALIGMTAAEVAAATATKGLTFAMNALGIVFKSISPMGWIGLAVTALTTLYTVTTMMTKTEEELALKAKETSDAFEAKQQSIKSLTAAYIENNKLTVQDDKSKEDLINTERQLKDALGSTGEGLDLQNGKLEDNIALIKKASKTELEEYIKTNELRVKALKEGSETPKARSFGLSKVNLLKNFSDYGSVIEKMGITPTNITAEGTKGFKFSDKDYLKNLDSIIKKRNELIKSGVPKEFLEDIAVEYELIKKKIEVADKETKKLNDSQRDLVEANLPQLDKFSKKQKEIYDSAKTSVPTENLKQLVDIVGTFNGINIEDVSNKIKNIVPKESFIGINAVLVKLQDGLAITDDTATETATEIKKLDDAFKASIDNIQSLNTALQELSDNHKLSSKTQEQILLNYPQLLKYMDDEVTLSKKIEELIKTEQQSQRELYLTKLEGNDKYYKDVVLKNADLVNILANAYGADLENFKNFNALKGKSSDLLIQMLGVSWGNFYKTEEAALEGLLEGVTVMTGEGRVSREGEIPLSMQGMTPEEKQRIINQKDIMTKQLEALKAVRKTMQTDIKKIDLEGLDTKKATGEKSSPLDIERLKNEKDELEKYQRPLEAINRLIAENKANQEQANISVEDQIKLKKEEIKLLEKQKGAYNDLAFASGDIAEKAKERLTSLKVGFDKEGNVDLSTYDKIRDKRTSDINEMKTSTEEEKQARQDAINELDKIKADKELYESMLEKKSQSLISKSGSKKESGAIAKSIKDDEIDILLSNSAKVIDPVSQKLKTLKANYDFLGDTQYAEKISNLNDQIASESKIIPELNKEYSALEQSLFALSDAGEEGTQTYIDTQKNMFDILDKINSARTNIAATNKKLSDEKIKNIFADSDVSAQKYAQSIDNLSVKYDLLDENDFAGKNQIISEKLKETSIQVKKDAELLEQLKLQKDQNIITDDEYKKKIEEVSKRHQDGAKNIKQFLNQYNNNILEEAKNDIDAINASLEQYVTITELANEKLKILQELQPKNFSGIDTAINDVMGASNTELLKTQTEIQDIIAKRKTASDEKVFKAYDEQLDKLYSKESSLIDNNAKLAKDKLKNQFAEVNLNLEKTLFPGTTLEEEKEKINELKKTYDEYITGQEKDYTLQLIKNDLNIWNNNLLNQRIDIFDTQISQMEQMDKLSRDDLESLQKKIEIKKLQIELENEQNEKTSKVIRKNEATGQYGYIFEADQKKIRETQDQLLKAQIDATKFQQQTDLKNQETALSDKENIMKEVETIQQKALDGQYDTQEEFNKDMDKLNEHLVKKYGATWTGVNGITSITDSAKNTINNCFNAMKTNFTTFSANMETSMNTFNVMYAEKSNVAIQKANELTDAINRANTALATQSSSSSSGGSTSNNNTYVPPASYYGNTGTSPVVKAQPSAIEIAKEDIGKIQQKWNELNQFVINGVATSDQVASMAMMSQNAENLRKQYGLSFENLVGYVAKADTGMYSGNKEGLIYMHQKELVLNQQDSKNYLDFTNLLRKNSDMPFVSTGRSNTSPVNNYITNVNIEKVVADNADKLAQQIRNYTFKIR